MLGFPARISLASIYVVVQTVYNYSYYNQHQVLTYGETMKLIVQVAWIHYTVLCCVLV